MSYIKKDTQEGPKTLILVKLSHRMLQICSQRLKLELMLINRRFISVSLALISLMACSPDSVIDASVIDTGEMLCDFNKGACERTFDGQHMSLTLSPPHAPSDQSLTAILKSSVSLEGLQASLAGRDMFMGTIPVFFTEVGENTYKATFTYGSCSSGYMVWRLSLNGEPLIPDYHFDFKADNRP
ncbi:hypothetical protein [Shewanella sp. NIFS-20-20]|uniref:hypothetical protein n=1 Tax=Shewanella sp. NIFS-20-20 TaxID=2853806 RepID=UPI001C46B0E1|nr:hypothetical protein [Shewanella sp. NIFS-20-20]MBV7315689.1 hypothetical protein [Shewanella sp. NIFS-20-20]